jgi:hypothetical protein
MLSSAYRYFGQPFGGRGTCRILFGSAIGRFRDFLKSLDCLKKLLGAESGLLAPLELTGSFHAVPLQNFLVSGFTFRATCPCNRLFQFGEFGLNTPGRAHPLPDHF